MLSVVMRDKFSAHILAPYSDTIAEMSATAEQTTDFAIDVDTSKIANLLKRDKEPMFVTLPIACEGRSVNGRNYTAANVESIVQQINDNHPDGYAGHLTDDERAHKTPDAQTIWLGAVVKEMDGKKVAYAKGYVMPSVKSRREYLQAASDIGKKVSVSIYGKFDGWYDKTKKTYDIAKIHLESVDWSRLGAEGLPVSATPLIASGMNQDLNRGDPDIDKVEALKSATLTEMQEHNPALKAELEKTSGVVREMVEVRTQLGADEKTPVKETIAEMQKQIREHTLTDELRDRVKVPAARPIIRQMVIGEMRSDESVTDTIERVLKTDDAKSIISSKSGAPSISPTNHTRRQATGRKFTKA